LKAEFDALPDPLFEFNMERSKKCFPFWINWVYCTHFWNVQRHTRISWGSLYLLIYDIVSYKISYESEWSQSEQ